MTKQYSLEQARRDLPVRSRKDSKTRGGKCLIVAGSPGQWGAAILCAQAAARSGAGYVSIYDPTSQFPIHHHPDFLTVQKIKNLTNFDAIAIGPGFKNPRIINSLIKKLKTTTTVNVVLDAEALNTLAKRTRKFKLPEHWILTPHEGELSRLLRVSSELIRSRRRKFVKTAQRTLGGTIVLKGFKTLIANKTTTLEIQSGNPALAKAGTGDVLTGVIAGFLSQKSKPMTAACLGAFIHGLCADQWVRSGHDQLSLLASDLLVEIPKILAAIRRKTPSNI